MRVTFILPQWWLRPIGGYAVVFGHADGLAKRGHKVAVRLGRPRDGPLLVELERREAAGEPLVSWRAIDPRVQLLAVPAIDDAYIPDADAVVATSANTVADVLRLAPSKGHRLQFIQGYETWMTDPEVLKASWRASTTKMVVSEWLLRVGESLGAGSLHLTPSAIDHDRFWPQRPLEARAPRLLTLHHHAPIKGWAHTAPVLSRFREARPDIPVSVFGTPPRPSDLPEWAEYHRDPADMAGLYNRATIFLSGGLTEGFGLTGAEALACGAALVTTSSGGVEEYALDGETALLSPPGDEGALLTNLLRMAEDRALAVRTATNGRALVARYTWPRALDSMEQVLLGTM